MNGGTVALYNSVCFLSVRAFYLSNIYQIRVQIRASEDSIPIFNNDFDLQQIGFKV
jgi:hypothetical protein